MRDLLVPVYGVEIVGASNGRAQAEGLAGVIEVVDVELALCTGGSEQFAAEGVELERLDGTAVLGDAGNEGVPGGRGGV